MEKINMDNLLSGFLGAVIALFIALFIERIKSAFRLDKTRKAITIYYGLLAIPSLVEYEQDCRLAIKTISDPANSISIKSGGFSVLTALTSDVVKSFNHSEIMTVINKNPEIYCSIIEVNYTIDFIKSRMPSDILETYESWVQKFFDDHNIKSRVTQMQYFDRANPTEINLNRDVQLKNLNAHAKSAIQAKEAIELILKKLDGKSIVWVLKYMLRQ